jgi:hypothetical protein
MNLGLSLYRLIIVSFYKNSYMLELRAICENCGKSLPNKIDEAMICTFECTFCADCVENVLKNVCPNCGGGFERRPTRPTHCLTPDCLQNYPAQTEKNSGLWTYKNSKGYMITT